MHSRTPGPKQTIPARLKADCDNQIEDYILLWGVRWTNSRRPSRRKQDFVHFNTPNSSDAPQSCCASSSSPSLIHLNAPTHHVPNTVPSDVAHGGSTLPSVNVSSPTGHQHNSSFFLSDMVSMAVGPSQTRTSRSLPQVELAQSVNLDPPASADRTNFPAISRLLEADLMAPSLSPTPLFAARPTVSSAQHSLMAGDCAVSPPSSDNDSTEYTERDPYILDYRGDDIGPGFFAHPLQYQLSSHSELAVFASDNELVPSTEGPTQQPVAREGSYSPSRW